MSNVIKLGSITNHRSIGLSKAQQKERENNVKKIKANEPFESNEPENVIETKNFKP
jgi:hypothetical protein